MAEEQVNTVIIQTLELEEDYNYDNEYEIIYKLKKRLCIYDEQYEHFRGGESIAWNQDRQKYEKIPGGNTVRLVEKNFSQYKDAEEGVCGACRYMHVPKILFLCSKDWSELKD